MAGTAGKTAILQVRDLCKDYPMGEITVRALKHVDMDLYEGEMTVLLGASGSGKSTLLNIIGGLDVASSGSVRYRDEELSQFSDRELTNYRRFHVGFVFQFYNLISSLTARENVALVTDICTDPMSPAQALDLVGLAGRMDHFPSQLSGGEQQRVAIARAIAKRPQILLCDEPTGALDSKTGQLVLGVLDYVNRETNTTTAIITHNAAIGNLGDVVVRMSSGEIVERVENKTRMNVADIQW
ncbi:MAG: ABC transporter ATP-binding protein [Gammaproteobacteria bacterium]|jgi:putative ABC transport system ATP-binding protein